MLFVHTQWGRGTVFQEDYFDLLNAAETGMKITYSPNDAAVLLKNFTTLYNNGITEVNTTHTYMHIVSMIPKTISCVVHNCKVTVKQGNFHTLINRIVVW